MSEAELKKYLIEQKLKRLVGVTFNRIPPLTAQQKQEQDEYIRKHNLPF